jgi:hypothetical protein
MLDQDPHAAEPQAVLKPVPDIGLALRAGISRDDSDRCLTRIQGVREEREHSLR